jgi:hypothetical protein
VQKIAHVLLPSQKPVMTDVPKGTVLLAYYVTLLNQIKSMIITIKKGEGKKEIAAAIKRLEKNTNKPALIDFFGKLKGKFGDGLSYQKAVRDEWS